MKEKFVIKIFDTPLIKFEAGPVGALDYEIAITEVDQSKAMLFPIGLMEMGVAEWLRARSIPKNREFVNKILASIGHPVRPIDIVKIGLGLSVTDAYWVVPENFEGEFSQYNLYDNEFSSALQLAAFTGYTSNVKGITTSPELTTNGMLKKCWRRVNGEVYLYKGGASGAANTGLEPYSEYYAYQVAERMGLNAIEYNLAKFKGELVSVCRLFTSKQYSFVPIWYVTDCRVVKNAIDAFGEKNFSDMIIFDAVICNTDRHFGNFGLLRDNYSGMYVGAAPLFDHGMSLFNFGMKEDIRNINEYAKTRLNAFNTDQVYAAKSFIGNSQREALIRLINFKFERHKSYNLPEWRLASIEKFIQYRISELLD